jgi:CheY-like chemotaxis protein
MTPSRNAALRLLPAHGGERWSPPGPERLENDVPRPDSDAVARLARLAARCLHVPVAVVALRVDATQLVVAGGAGVETGRLLPWPPLDDPADHAPACAMARALGVRTCLVVPLRRGGAIVGVVAAGDLAPRAWSAHEIGILEEITTLAALAGDEPAPPAEPCACTARDAAPVALAPDAGERHAERIAGVGSVLSGLAHELNNPLTSIKSFAQLLLLDDRSAEDRDGLEVIQQEAERAARLVADLRRLVQQAQLSARRTWEPVDANELVRRVVREWRASGGASRLAVETRLADELFLVRGDSERLAEAVRDLVHHADRHSAVRRVVIRTRASRRGVAVSVLLPDAGPGGDREADLLHPFRGSGVRGRRLEPGISLAHITVEQHGGEVRAERVRAGVEFCLDLPCTGRAPRGEEGEFTAAAPLHILLVEPAASVRASLADYLRGRGHRVTAVADVRRAERVLASGAAIDTVVTGAPDGTSGCDDAAERLLAFTGPTAPRLLFLVDEEARAAAERAAHRLGGAPVVVRPFALAELADLLERRVPHAGGAGP